MQHVVKRSLRTGHGTDGEIGLGGRERERERERESTCAIATRECDVTFCNGASGSRPQNLRSDGLYGHRAHGSFYNRPLFSAAATRPSFRVGGSFALVYVGETILVCHLDMAS